MQEYLINATAGAAPQRSVHALGEHRPQPDAVPSARRPILAGGAVVTREHPLRGTEV